MSGKQLDILKMPLKLMEGIMNERINILIKVGLENLIDMTKNNY